MRVAVAAAILGAALLASASSQTSETPRTSDSLERSFASNGRVRMNLSAGGYTISGTPDDHIRLEWSVRDADALPKVHARAEVRGQDYHAVDGSVWAGDIHAAPFDIVKGGLFRSFDWTGKGPYRLHAKLKAGDIRLYSKGAV